MKPYRIHHGSERITAIFHGMELVWKAPAAAFTRLMAVIETSFTIKSAKAKLLFYTKALRTKRVNNLVSAQAKTAESNNQLAIARVHALSKGTGEQLNTLKLTGAKLQALVSLETRRLAPLFYTKALRTKRVNNLVSAQAKTAESNNQLAIARVHALSKGTGEQLNTLKLTGAKLQAISVSAKSSKAKASRNIAAEYSAAANSNYGVSIAASRNTGFGQSAMIATWAYPEIVDGVLVIRQVYSAEEKNDRLEVQ